MMLEVLLLLMKNRPRYYGRNFCGNVEMECIVKSALTGGAEYRATGRVSKQNPLVSSSSRTRVPVLG
jgi:hypothetical protein